MSAECPPDPSEMADEYVTGHLSAEDYANFHAHIQSCASCAEIVTRTVEFRQGLRAAIANDPDLSKERGK